MIGRSLTFVRQYDRILAVRGRGYELWFLQVQKKRISNVHIPTDWQVWFSFVLCQLLDQSVCWMRNAVKQVWTTQSALWENVAVHPASSIPTSRTEWTAIKVKTTPCSEPPISIFIMSFPAIQLMEAHVRAMLNADTCYFTLTASLGNVLVLTASTTWTIHEGVSRVSGKTSLLLWTKSSMIHIESYKYSESAANFFLLCFLHCLIY